MRLSYRICGGAHHPYETGERIMALHIIDVIKYEGGNDTFVWKHG